MSILRAENDDSTFLFSSPVTLDMMQDQASSKISLDNFKIWSSWSVSGLSESKCNDKAKVSCISIARLRIKSSELPSNFLNNSCILCRLVVTVLLRSFSSCSLRCSAAVVAVILHITCSPLMYFLRVEMCATVSSIAPLYRITGPFMPNIRYSFCSNTVIQLNSQRSVATILLVRHVGVCNSDESSFWIFAESPTAIE